MRYGKFFHHVNYKKLNKLINVFSFIVRNEYIETRVQHKNRKLKRKQCGK